MPWFLVDDRFHSSKTLRKILATEPAAVGLWTVAGAWSSENLAEGFVPDDVLPWLFPDAPRLAEALVTARAWRRVKGGHKFVSDGTHKIPSKETVEHQRKLKTERQNRWREGQSRRPVDASTAPSTDASPLDPLPLPKELPPNPPQAGGHRGQHKHCRACGTNQRGPAPEPPPTPMPPPYQPPNGAGRVASEDVADLLAGTRQAITQPQESP